MSGKYISELEQKILTFAQEAQQKKENAGRFKAKHYFEGQGDAFEQVLLDLKKLKYELEAHADDAEESKEAPAKKRGPKKQPDAPSPDELYPEQAALLKEAKDAGVIIQKSSHFFYKAFTTGKQPGRLQGRLNVYKELANEEFAQRLREEIAKFTQPA